MEKYLLNSEKKQINILLNDLEKILYQPNIPKLKNIFSNIIINNKDASIEDILNNILDQLIIEMKPLLDNNLTLGIQFGIKNNYFKIESYGGYYLSNNKLYNINKETLFSFDSISKLITSIITMYNIRNNEFTLKTRVNQYNKEYNLDATIESILKFTAYIKTSKRIDNLPIEDTITLLKECKENLIEKAKTENFYEYNDIGYMILRQIIPNFLNELDKLINHIDSNNLTYNYINNKRNITGGKIKEEYMTPDPKGKGIIFPGHTGLYGNIEGLLNLYDIIMNTNSILTKEEKEILLKQPYNNPITFHKEKNKYQYTSKIAGLIKVPEGITTTYDKLSYFDIPNQTTKNATVSAGTCGSWVMSDNLTTNNKFSSYVAGILTNPYSFVENKIYPDSINNLKNTTLTVNKKGTIMNYPKQLNTYKETITTYAIILELITEYIKLNDKEALSNNRNKFVKRIKSNTH